MPGADFDPIDFELFKNSAFAIADEMALTISRVAYSPILRDTMDYSTALTDAAGTDLKGFNLPQSRARFNTITTAHGWETVSGLNSGWKPTGLAI